MCSILPEAYLAKVNVSWTLVSVIYFFLLVNVDIEKNPFFWYVFDVLAERWIKPDKFSLPFTFLFGWRIGANVFHRNVKFTFS